MRDDGIDLASDVAGDGAGEGAADGGGRGGRTPRESAAGSRRLGVAAALVSGALLVGDVTVGADGKVEAIGLLPAGRHGVAVPGFVDLQVNGFAGVDLAVADLDGYRRVGEGLARCGVTSYLPTIPTAAPAEYGPALAVASSAVTELSGGPGGPGAIGPRRGSGAGRGARPLAVHLEGPFLAAARAGAHRRQHFRPADVTLAERLLRAAPVALMTVAAELPGSVELITRLRSLGVVVALGHSDATAAEARAAFDAGAVAVTHLWNAQRPVTAREAGLVGVALSRPDVTVCLIADLVHVAPETLLLSFAAARDRLVVVTDAVALAGLGDGDHLFGGRPVTSAGGAVRLGDGTLAGSACPMDASLRNLVGLGVPLAEAVATMTLRPARLLGRSDIGRLVSGVPADVVVLADDLSVQRVLIGGVEV